MKKKLLLVGDSGYLGSSLVDSLSHHFEVTGLSRTNGSSTKICKIQLNLEHDAEKVLELVSEFDYIIWAAGLSPIESLNDKNKDYFLTVTLIKRVLEALSNINRKPKIIYFCSKYIYGNHSQIDIQESEILNPSHDYGMNRILILKEFVNARKEYAVDASMVVLPGVYGYKKSGQVHKGAINTLIHSAIRKKIINLYQTARYSRNVLHVDDFVNAITLLCLKKKALKYPMYNLVSNELTTIEEISRIVCSKYSGIRVIETCDERYSAFEKGDLVLSCKRFSSEFDWQPLHDLSPSIGLMIQSLAENDDGK